MAGGKLFGGSNMTVLLQNERLPCSSEVLESLWVHSTDPPSFQGDFCSLSHSVTIPSWSFCTCLSSNLFNHKCSAEKERGKKKHIYTYSQVLNKNICFLWKTWKWGSLFFPPL